MSGRPLSAEFAERTVIDNWWGASGRSGNVFRRPGECVDFGLVMTRARKCAGEYAPLAVGGSVVHGRRDSVSLSGR
jgi:hypothetical protein